jgi:hypothetical protein
MPVDVFKFHNGWIEDITTAEFFKALNQAECADVRIQRKDEASPLCKLPCLCAIKSSRNQDRARLKTSEPEKLTGSKFMGSIKKRRKAKINKHKRRKKLRLNRHKKRTWQK